MIFFKRCANEIGTKFGGGGKNRIPAKGGQASVKSKILFKKSSSFRIKTAQIFKGFLFE
jgi:hypothetical protein